MLPECSFQSQEGIRVCLKQMILWNFVKEEAIFVLSNSSFAIIDRTKLEVLIFSIEYNTLLNEIYSV